MCMYVARVVCVVCVMFVECVVCAACNVSSVPLYAMCVVCAVHGVCLSYGECLWVVYVCGGAYVARGRFPRETEHSER